MATTNGTTAANGIPPKLTLYTNHGCPWAQRAHIALKALNLPFEEIIIDLDTPREEWYLKVNPVNHPPHLSIYLNPICTDTSPFQRGLVPSLRITNGVINDEIITESAVVTQFLADAYPSPTFFPASRSTPTAPLERARIAFFVDAYFSKCNPLLFAAIRQDDPDEKAAKENEFAAAIKKEIEPLLPEEGPFFGGSKDLTLAEVRAFIIPSLCSFSTQIPSGVISLSCH